MMMMIIDIDRVVVAISFFIFENSLNSTFS